MTQHRLVGYIVNGVIGWQGAAYDYIFAGNGVFLRAERLDRRGEPLLRGMVPVAELPIRGLAPVQWDMVLPHGRVPPELWSSALRLMREDPGLELAVCIVWSRDPRLPRQYGSYQMVVPEQRRSAGRVEYEPVPDTVVDLHSHGTMRAFFSSTDDADDQGFRISGVVGRLDRPSAQVTFRLGIYGGYQPLRFRDVFELGDGTAPQQEVVIP